MTDFANNLPPINLGAKKGRVVPGQTFEVEGRRSGEIFELIGIIDKGNATGLAVYVSRWRGITHIELHEMERMHTTFSRTSVRTFLPPRHADRLVELLGQASEFVGTLPAPKKVAVRKQTQPKGNEPNENE